MTVKDIIAQISNLQSYVFTIGRLNYVELLLQCSIDSKLECSKTGYELINEAFHLENILHKFLNKKPKTFKWNSTTLKYVKKSIKKNDIKSLIKLKLQYQTYCISIIQFLENNLENDSLVGQLKVFLKNLKLVLSENELVNINTVPVLGVKGDGNYQRVLYGPNKMKVDNVFEPTYDILENQTPEFGNNLDEVVPYFWSLALREILASELCSLSIIEYDNLPLQYYWDFSKQSWDEARHSNVYLNLSLSFFSEIESKPKENFKLLSIVKKFKETGTGLEVPKEKNMYEAILNSDLEERLILMNILTEAPAIGRLTRKMKQPICKQYPEIKRIFEFDKVDESFHARIGNYWLKFLIPDSKERRQKIGDTKLLRGLILLSSISEYSESNLIEMAEKFSTN